MDDNIRDEEAKSSPVILDNVENFMLNIEEEIKNQEDNGDLDNDFHNDVDDVDDTDETDEEVDDKQIELSGLPEADRAKQRVVTTENMKNKNISDNNPPVPTKNDEETESVMDVGFETETEKNFTKVMKILDVDYETETVKNVTKFMKIVDQKTVESRNPIQEKKDSNKKGERLKLPRIRIQNARIKILSKVESETNNDDIVFIIYLNESDSREIESNAGLEDFIFQN